MLFKSSKGTYKLAKKGFEVVDSGLTLEFFNAQNETDPFGEAQAFYFGNAIADAASKKTGSLIKNPLMRHKPGEPILLPLPPVENKSVWKKFVDLRDSPLINQRIAFWAGISGIIGLFIALIALKG